MGCLHSRPGDAVPAGKEADGPPADRAFVLLGAHRAGKTTLLRHLELALGELHGEGARRAYAAVVREAVAAFANLITQQVMSAAALRPDAVPDALAAEARRLNEAVEGGLSPAAAEAFAAFARSGELAATLQAAGAREERAEDLEALADTATRCAEDEYEARDEDVLRLQWLSVGVNARDFEAPAGVVRVVDVGGRYPERTKWAEVLADADGPAAGATAVFVAALDGFSQQMAESPERNELLEAIELFGDVCKDHPGLGTVLVLTKEDRFRAAYAEPGGELAFSRCLTGFGGGTADEAIAHVASRFEAARKGGGGADGDAAALRWTHANVTDPSRPSPLLELFNESMGAERSARGPRSSSDAKHRRMHSADDL